MNTIDLSGKRALVTGGSQGIGSEICRELAACGADVFINYYNSKEKAEKLALEIKKEFGVNTWVGRADVANSKEVIELFSMMDNTTTLQQVEKQIICHKKYYSHCTYRL